MENEENIILCPVCGKKIANNPKDNIFQIESIDSDFRIHTVQDDLLDDWLLICNNCYYIDHDFSIVPENLNEVKNYVESAEYLDKFSDNNPTTYDLFENYSRILNIKKGSSFLFADCNLRIAWLYDDDNLLNSANEYREKSIQYFGRALLERENGKKNESMIYYYITELSRRKGEFKRAKKALKNMERSFTEIDELYKFQKKLIEDKNSNNTELPKRRKGYGTLS